MTVISNDPVSPRFQLTMKGEVEMLAGFEPDRLSFGDVLLGAKPQQVVAFTSQREGLELVEVRATNEQVVPRLVKKNGKTTLEVTLNAGDKPGRVFANVVATTNQDDLKELTLRVDGRVTADLVLDRDRVALAVDETGKATPAEVTLRSLSGKKFKVTRVEDPKGSVTSTASEVGDGSWRIKLELPDGQAATNGSLQVHTNHAEVPTVNLTYVIAKRPAPGAMNLERRPLGAVRPAIDERR